MTEEKKVALVTGGSRGIGKACALELAKSGYDVVINYAGNDAAANETVGELKALGVEAEALKFNVADKDAAKEAVAKIFEKFGRIDVLVNNAGITRDGLAIRMSYENWEDVINTNLNSMFYVTKPVVEKMLKQKSGAVINMASVCGVYGNAGQLNYSSAKAGVIGFTKALAKEVASRGITVNAVAPGFVNTEMTEVLSDKVKEGAVAQIPLGKFGEPEDIANAVAFLASDDAKYITGQVLNVDGGMAM